MINKELTFFMLVVVNVTCGTDKRQERSLLYNFFSLKFSVFKLK